MRINSNQPLVLGTDGADDIAGGPDVAAVFAGAGDDWVQPGGDYDWVQPGVGGWAVSGGAGNDTIWGGPGEQLLMGDEGNDLIGAGWGTSTLLGGAGDDTILGTSDPQADILEGGDGNDTLYCRMGTPTVFGGAGDDTVYAVSEWLPDFGHNLIFGGDGNDYFSVQRIGGDTVFGGAGADTFWVGNMPPGAHGQYLDGGPGNDTFRAGEGNATLVGGAGRDSFVFSEIVDRQSVIADFQAGQDIIHHDAFPWFPPKSEPLPPHRLRGARPGRQCRAAPGPRRDGDAARRAGSARCRAHRDYVKLG